MRIVMTGGAGGVARMIRDEMKAIYPDLVLSDRVVPGDLPPGLPFVQADLTDLAAVERLLAGADGLVHLGGQSVEAPWEVILDANIRGLYNAFEAARRQRVKRVVFASSNHVMGFYRRQHRIGVDAVPRPDSRYGVSKMFGEALGALYADKHGLRVLSIRIGNVGLAPVDKRRLAIWLHPEDLVQLIRIGIEHPGLGYEVVYGASENERCWWDNSRAYALGYRPRHKAEDHAAQALAEEARLAPDPIAAEFQGGPFCSDEYTRR